MAVFGTSRKLNQHQTQRGRVARAQSRPSARRVAIGEERVRKSEFGNKFAMPTYPVKKNGWLPATIYRTLRQMRVRLQREAAASTEAGGHGKKTISLGARLVILKTRLGAEKKQANQPVVVRDAAV